jgi:vacuolar-type H+-ATPase subunit H
MIRLRTGKTPLGFGDPSGHDHVVQTREKDTSSMGKTKTKKMREHASDLAEKLAPHVESAIDKAGPILSDARDKAGPLLSDARDKAGPLLADARDKAAPVVADARERLNNDVLPAISAAIAAASEATEDVRGEAKKRGLAAAAALKGEVEAPKKRHRVRKLLIVLGLGGLVAAIAKKKSSRQPETAWQSSYTPPPAPTNSTAKHRVAADATPDGTLTDAVEPETDAPDGESELKTD